MPTLHTSTDRLRGDRYASGGSGAAAAAAIPRRLHSRVGAARPPQPEGDEGKRARHVSTNCPNGHLLRCGFLVPCQDGNEKDFPSLVVDKLVPRHLWMAVRDKKEEYNSQMPVRRATCSDLSSALTLRSTIPPATSALPNRAYLSAIRGGWCM